MSATIQPVVSTQSSARLSVAFYFLAYGGLGASMAIVGPTLPALADNIGVTLTAISAILVARSLGYIVGSLLGGWLYDHYWGHPVMAGSLTLGAVAVAATPGIPSLWLLSVVFFIMGIALSMLDVGGNTLLIWFHGRKSGPYMNGLHFAFGIGALAAPLVVVQIVQWTGTFDWAYRMLAVLIFLPVVFLLRLRSPRNAKSAQVAGETSPKNMLLVGVFALIFLFYVGSEASFGDWVYTYGVESGLESEVTAGYLTSVFWAVFTIGRLLAIPVAARVRPRIILLVDFIGMVVSLAVLSLWGDSQVILWGGTILLGLAMASVFAAAFSLAERQLTITGRVTSIFFVGASGGAMFFSWLTAQALGRYGPGAMMVVFLISAALGLLCLILILGLIKKRG
jgi:MFS transporter, FHS family, Na+ dependent glucose transporter 1